MTLFRATLHVWPHSTGEGAAHNQALAGARVQTVELSAQDMSGALRQAELFARGVETNPAVWQAPVFKIERVEP